MEKDIRHSWAIWGALEGDIGWVGVHIKVHNAQPHPERGTHTGSNIVRLEPGTEGNRPVWCGTSSPVLSLDGVGVWLAIDGNPEHALCGKWSPGSEPVAVGRPNRCSP